MSQEKAFGAVLSALYAAAFDASLWPRASGRIDEACGTRGNTIVVARGLSQPDVDVLCASSCEHGERRKDWERDYFRKYYPTDERVPRLATLEDGRLVPADDLFTDSERKASPTYNELMPMGGYQKALHTRMDGPEGASIYYALAEPAAGGEWETGQVETIKALLPHLRHCVATHYALCSSRSLGLSLHGLLDTTGLGIIQLDRLGQVIEMNDRARGMLNGRRGLFEQGRFLYARLPADDLRLRQLVANSLPRLWGPAVGGSMPVTRQPGQPRQVVHVVPVGKWQDGFGGRVAVLVLVREPGGVQRFDADYVSMALGLTRTESRVAMALAAGRTVGEISIESGREMSTARFHIRRIFAKLGLSRQADLIRLVLSLADPPEHRGQAGLDEINVC